MKTSNLVKKMMALMAMGAVGFAISCTEQEAPYQEEAAYVAEDAVTDFAFEDADDLAGLAMEADEGTSGGRMATGPIEILINDPRCQCDNLTVTIEFTPNSTQEVPVGTIVFDFGDGCEDIFGNVRKGKIIVNFVGRRFLPGSVITTTFDGYSINDIALEGVRTLTNISASSEDSPMFQVTLEDGKATWPDGNVATREHCFVRTWIRALNPLNDELEVVQCDDVEVAASGTNRRGRAYTMSILEPIVYKRGCPLAVSGVKEFTDVASGKVITVDYGDGECDRIITITVGGESRNVNVGRRG